MTFIKIGFMWAWSQVKAAVQYYIIGALLPYYFKGDGVTWHRVLYDVEIENRLSWLVLSNHVIRRPD